MDTNLELNDFDKLKQTHLNFLKEFGLLNSKVDELRLKLFDKEKEFTEFQKLVKTDLTTKNEEIKSLKDKIKSQLDNILKFKEDLKKDLTNINLLKKENESLLLKIKEEKNSCSSENHVSLDGERFPILYRNIQKEYVNDFYKRLTEDEQFTVVVIPKIGG